MRRLLLAACLCACSAPAQTQTENAALGGEVAARVGDQTIGVKLVGSVATAEKIEAREALRRLVDDEVAAASARTKGLDGRAPAAWRLVALRGRLTANRIMDEARKKGPPTDEEITKLSERFWSEVDLPPTARVVHAIVLDRGEEAKKVVQSIREQVLSAESPADFDKRARAAYAASGTSLKFTAEELPAFAPDGRIPNSPSSMDKAFAEGAFKLSRPGDTSIPVQSSFGWHVIRLIEMLPERRMPMETRRVAFAEEAYKMRSQEMLDAILKPLRATNEVTISPAAEELMRGVAIPKKEK